MGMVLLALGLGALLIAPDVSDALVIQLATALGGAVATVCGVVLELEQGWRD